MKSNAVIFGCQGLSLTNEEAAFFQDVRPWGFILFKRNIENPDQVRRLVDALRGTINQPMAPILIDQEGGRVQRLGPPYWRRYPAVRAYGTLAANDPLARREIARLGARLMADDLNSLGINVNCLPVLDLPSPGAHDVIGDRAYGLSVADAASMGRAAAEGLIAGGVLPVIKHVPGHGRAEADSHLSLPVVDATLADLSAHDFEPFRILSDMPMAMTAHVVYRAIDPANPATTSRRVIRQIIRKSIGFGGLIMSDDLSMKALAGNFGERTQAAQGAGCDVVLHCNGQMAEMVMIAEAVKALGGPALKRAKAAMARIARRPEPFNRAEALARFDAAFEGKTST